MTSIALLALFVNRLQAHSWTRCTDYKATINGLDYDESQCEGWIRGWTFDNIAFGSDRGVNYQVGMGTGQALCDPNKQALGSEDNDYGLREDKATQYTPGSTVRLVWPAKNHANYECFANIPDTSMKLFMNPNKDPTADLPNTESTMTDNGYVLVHDFQDGCQAGTDGCGFQNCRKFCENTGAATCFGDFVVPEVGASGWYTFVWYWVFNGGTAPYTSCFEAYIDITGEVTTPDDGTTDDTTGNTTISDYITTVPVCVTGDSYDESEVTAFAEAQFESVADAVYISSQCDAADDNGFEFTVQVKHSTPGTEVVAVAQDTFCDSFESEFGGSSCDINDDCGEIVTFASYELVDTAPSPTEAADPDALQITLRDGAGAYYFQMVLSDDCDGAVTKVQYLKDGEYYDNQGYWYAGGHTYDFNYAQSGDNFQEMLPITLRVVLTSGEVIVLEDIIENLNAGSTFSSTKTCDGSEAGDDTEVSDGSNICSGTPAPTVPTPAPVQTPAPSTANQTPAPTTGDSGSDATAAPTTADSEDVTLDAGNASGAVRFGQFAAAAIACVLVFFSLM